MEKIIIVDGTNSTMGRLASYSAKQVLIGKEVIILNANDVIISGDKKNILLKWKELVKKGGSSQKGPNISRTPERILKRVIRGMLSHKQSRGSEALKRVKCYNEIPEKYKDKEKISGGREKKGKYITLKELSELLKQ